MGYVFTDVTDLVANIALEDIFCVEERGRRIQLSDEEAAKIGVPSSDNSMAVNRIGPDVHFRFRTRFTDKSAEYVADWVAHFRLPEELDGQPLEDDAVSVDLAHEFARRVAFFAAYPYLRASIYGSASRLNLPVPVLGIVRQGEFELGQILSDEEMKQAFFDNASERLSGGQT